MYIKYRCEEENDVLLYHCSVVGRAARGHAGLVDHQPHLSQRGV
jgi:hypothetical protein